MFCNTLVKRYSRKDIIYFIMDKKHSQECYKLTEIEKKNETNLIENYNNFIQKCFNYLDSIEMKSLIKKII